MRVVLFCGGLGMRLREHSDLIPKPMVNIGYRPILWHVMKYYAHYGHTEFILCLGWKANVIKDYFLNYQETYSNDFVLDGRKNDIRLLGSDIEDWKITFCDTGVNASIGQRLLAVREHLDGEYTFLANYTDGLTDANLNDVIDFHQSRKSEATFLSVPPSQSFHVVEQTPNGQVHCIETVGDAGVMCNGGFFVLNHQVFDHLAGQDLIDGALVDLAKQGQCYSYEHRGFWACMDTFKEMHLLQDMYNNGSTPWTVWDAA